MYKLKSYFYQDVLKRWINMFSPIAIVIYIVGFLFYIVSYLLKQNLFYLTLTKCIVWAMSLIVTFFVLCVVISIVFSVKCFFGKIYVGKPPVGKMTIAYKFKDQNEIDGSLLEEIKTIFPSYEIVHLCYSSVTSTSVSIAYGVILNEAGLSIDYKLRIKAKRNGYTIFEMPSVQNAVYLEYPTLPWLWPSLSLWMYWIVLSRMYPLLYTYTEKHRLSAYPVIEIYRTFSLVLLAPLSRQDDFVVKEALSTIHRASISMDFSRSNSISMSHSMCSKATSLGFQSSEGLLKCNGSKPTSYSLG